MKFARYWTRQSGAATDPSGQSLEVLSRGWSDVSLADAAERAQDRARKLAARLLTDRNASNLYDYADAPVPEPIVQDFRPQGTAAVVTRNSYGSLVLNTDELLFADVDTKSPESQLSAIASQYGFSLRLYQTAAGYRVMVTNKHIRGGTNDAEAILTKFGSDPLYMRLCRTQQSFRARLTPKAWRCELRKPPTRFPFEDLQSQQSFDRWQAEYSQAIERYATCRLIKTVGNEVDPGFAKLIEYHDKETKVASSLPLA